MQPLAEVYSADEPADPFGLETLPLSRLPKDHPVGLFAQCYSAMVEGHLIPDERALLDDPVIEAISCWWQHVEPVELGNHVDFFVLSRGEAFSNAEREFVGGSWMSETLDERFLAARYHEAVTASILRKPRFSRGYMPSSGGSYIKQYRGVFPMFAENHARLRLAIVAAETFIELSDDD